MITTVTTVTTTVTTITALGVTTAISGAAIVALLIFLATRELASAGGSKFSWRIVKFAGIGIVPLLMAFLAIVTVKVLAAL
jgi:hypothetical protein